MNENIKINKYTIIYCKFNVRVSTNQLNFTLATIFTVWKRKKMPELIKKKKCNSWQKVWCIKRPKSPKWKFSTIQPRRIWKDNLASHRTQPNVNFVWREWSLALAYVSRRQMWQMAGMETKVKRPLYWLLFRKKVETRRETRNIVDCKWEREDGRQEGTKWIIEKPTLSLENAWVFFLCCCSFFFPEQKGEWVIGFPLKEMTVPGRETMFFFISFY